ncbi:hypothetical protein [Paraburkholderia rhizosphaerae]|uniref:Uncharacterized protein n=1 Tax=Paraburkholderia rhizosphaerae TaxID=480658 RepID=A0A4R8LRU1_9BURK|nr:hypothetical protein [Paraburkholderia rhizosphaerae]TDY48283.1 hypothetical protein BX592_111218 [Paraburkholderia rhizosphaerae]
MANRGIFTRVLADIFPGKPAPAAQQPQAAKPSPTPAPTQQPKVIGQGAANETHVMIAGVPNLFVDEGAYIVQFVPAFDEHTEETAFGLKILPDLIPHWAQARIHRCIIKDAIAAAIRGTAQPVPGPSEARRDGRAVPQPVAEPEDDDAAAPSAPSTPRAPRHKTGGTFDSAVVVGRITSWGEEKFPRRKGTGPRFYTSFAMHLDTVTGERVLQGEGLKDAIATARCEVGDVVSVRRLEKIKVQAFDEATGKPRMRDGKPVLWDKWLWSITK